jgi:hypothetical protein
LTEASENFNYSYSLSGLKIMKKVKNILKKRHDILIDDYQSAENKVAFLNNSEFLAEVENFTLTQQEEFLTHLFPLYLADEGVDDIRLSTPILALIIVKNLYINEEIKKLFNQLSALKKVLLLIRFLEDTENQAVIVFIKFWMSRLSSKEVMECSRKNDFFNVLLNMKEGHFFASYRSNFFATVWLNNNFLDNMESDQALNRKIMSLLLKEHKLHDSNGRLKVLEQLNPLSQYNLAYTMLDFIEVPEVFEYLKTFSYFPTTYLTKIKPEWIDSQEKLAFINRFKEAEYFISGFILDNYLDYDFIIPYFLDEFQELMQNKVNSQWQTNLNEMPEFLALAHKKLNEVPHDDLKKQFMEAVGAYNMSRLYRVDLRDFEQEEKHWQYSVENFYSLNMDYRNLVIEFRNDHSEDNFFDQFETQVKLHKYFGKLCFEPVFYESEENLENLKYFHAHMIKVLENNENHVEKVLGYLYNNDFIDFVKLSACHVLIWKQGDSLYCDSYVGHNMFGTLPKSFANYLEVLDTLKVLEGITDENFVKYLIYLYFINEKREHSVWKNILLTHRENVVNGNLGNNQFEKFRANYLQDNHLREILEEQKRQHEKEEHDAQLMKKYNLKKDEKGLLTK